MKAPAWPKILFLSAVLIALLYAFWPRPVRIRAVQVKRKDLQLAFTEEGETYLEDVYQIKAPVAGKLLRVKLKPGDRVRRGQVVAVLEAFHLEAEIARTQAELSVARADLEKLNDQQFDTLRLRKAQLAVEEAQASLAEAEAELSVRKAKLRREEDVLSRRKALWKKGALSEELCEEARLLRDARQAEVRWAEARLEVARKALLRAKSEKERVGREIERERNLTARLWKRKSAP